MAPMRFPHEPGLEQQAHLSEFCRGLESFAPAVLDFRNSLCLTKAARRFNASSRSRRAVTSKIMELLASECVRLR